MQLERLPERLTVCKVAAPSEIDWDADIYFVGKTDEELSLVCREADAPRGAVERDDGWLAFRVKGTLDFSLVGILAGLTGILAAQRIGIFAVSTYNTDYILVKEENFERALGALADAGHTVA